jgi:alpha-beta hydrolase superfamily lysophospholipase
MGHFPEKVMARRVQSAVAMRIDRRHDVARSSAATGALATMIRVFASIFLLAAGCATGGVTTRSAAPAPPPPAAAPAIHGDGVFDQVLDALHANAPGRLEPALNEAMRSALPGEKLAEAWAQVTAMLGPLQSWSGSAHEASGGGERRDYVLTFAHGTARLAVTVDADRHIAGLFITDLRVRTSCGDAEEREVEIGAAPPLPATIVLPAHAAAPVPAVVLISGSGPQDRDEAIGPNRPMLDLACGLAARGVASIRFAKRSVAAPASLHEPLTVDEEFANDAVSAVARLRGAPGIDPRRVSIVGHSLGGTIAPDVAARAQPVAGLVLIAAAVRDLGDTVIEQMRHLQQSDTQIASVAAAFARIRSGEARDTEMLLGASAHYWRDLFHRDAAATIVRVGAPALLLLGGCDYQVPEAEERAWRSRIGDRKQVTVTRLAGLNHFMLASCNAHGPADYDIAGHVDARVLDAIAAFVKDVPPTR